MHIEITDGSSKFPRKLFQFERALEFREQLVGCSLPKALILVLNASEWLDWTREPICQAHETERMAWDYQEASHFLCPVLHLLQAIR